MDTRPDRVFKEQFLFCEDQAVAIVQLYGKAHPLSVDERPITAPEVYQIIIARSAALDERMQTGNGSAIKQHTAPFSPTYGPGLTARQRILPAPGSSNQRRFSSIPVHGFPM